MSKLSFRARALDPSKPMPIYLAEELPDLPEYSAINRAVPQMPSGMEKEEESEHHLQRAICTGLIIPTPEVYEATDSEFYERYYAQDYKMPKQLIHMQPLNLEQDVPDYDMDSADEQWITTQGKRLDLDPLKFETMMDRLEKSSGQTVVTLNEAKALLKQDDELSIAVYDYWLNKRLKMQHPLILSVKTESRGNTTPNNPYLAFRRRTEKMQTRKNRKNDESSYEKMLKLRRDLSRAVTLLEMIKRREKIKREQLHLSIEVYEKRYQAQDFSGQMLAEFTSNATKASRPAFAPIYSNQYSSHHSALAAGQGVASGSGAGVYGSGSSSQYHVSGSSSSKRDNESLSSSRKEKRQYKKRKHKQQKDRTSGTSSAVAGSSGVGSAGLGSSGVGSTGGSGYHYQYHPAGVGGPSTTGSTGGRESAIAGVLGGVAADSALTSDEEELSNLQGTASPEEEYAYAFRRSKFSQYHKPITKGFIKWPWEYNEGNKTPDPRYRFALTSLRHPRPRCIGFARRRVGRGGRVIIDRASTTLDDLWSRLDYKIIETDTTPAAAVAVEPEEEPVVVSTVVPPVKSAVPILAPAAVSPLLLDKKIHSSGSSEFVVTSSGGIKRKRQLVIKEETDLDELFLAGVGLVRKSESQQESSVGSLVKVKQETCSDGRTSPTSETSAFVISSSSSTSGNVNNSENNVIKSEAGGDTTDVEIKQEVLEDYEHMIDNVNNSYRNRISNSSRSAATAASGNSSSNVNSRNNFIHSFSNSISGSGQNRELDHQQPSSSSSRSLSYQVTSGDSSRNRQIAEELGLDTGSPLDTEAIASVYTDLLDEIQSSWLHFRPKTPEPLPLEDDLLQDDPLFRTDANRIALELQSLGHELPLDIFNPPIDSVFRTKPFAMDSLVEPHPLGLESGASGSRKDGDDLGIKLETCSNSDNNLSGDSLNDLNLSLNESGEDEKMLDKILQECQIDDMKSLNQTSNFWNGILEDGILNQLEAADDAGAGAGADTKEDALVIGELASPPPVDGLAFNKLGYCSELVGYDRPATVERYKNKRRKILKRCNIQVGSSFFSVRNPPKEELFRKLSDSEDNVPVDSTEKGNEAAMEAAAAVTEVKVEEDSEPVSATIPADQIKIEPPDELLAASSPSAVTLPHSTSHLLGNATVLPPANTTFHHSLSAPQIKLEPINHLPQTVNSAVASSPAATSFLIASPSVQVVQQPTAVAAAGSATMLNSLVATAQTTVPVVAAQQVQQQQQTHGQITIATASPSSSASNSGTSTPTGSYIVQHTTPIVLSQQQMQQIATSGGNIVTVSGNQVVTTKQHLQPQQLQQQHQTQQIQIQNANALGETYFSLSPLKKQINGPTDKTAKQNVIGSRFLINQRLPGTTKPGDLNKKQLEIISKALDIRQKMMMKTANHNAGQVIATQAQQQQQIASGSNTYNVIHQNSLQQPITILSATSQNPQQPTQNKIILTSSPQLIQQAAGQLMAAAAANPHGKIAINSNLVTSGQQAQQFQTADGSGQGQSSTGGTVQAGQPQHVKLEKTVNMLFDADKNRIVYANIKNSRGQFLAQINPKVVNILQPIQQQKLANNVGALQAQQQQQQTTHQHTTTNVQNLLGASQAATIVNSKGGIQRIPAVSIRAQHQQQQQLAAQQLDSHGSGTTTVALATNHNLAASATVVSSASSAGASGTSGANATATPTSINITNR